MSIDFTHAKSRFIFCQNKSNKNNRMNKIVSYNF